MDSRSFETLRLLDRYRYGRSNFVAAYHGASQQNRKRELGFMRRDGLLATPEQQKASSNFRYSPRVYELAPKGKAALLSQGIEPVAWKGERQFWHQLMVTDIVLSFELACKHTGLHFQHRKDLVGDQSLVFDTTISHTYKNGRTETYEGRLQPDDLFAINGMYFVLEADRHNEPISRLTFQTSSYLRKILQYRDLMKRELYKSLFPNLLIINISTSEQHARNVMKFMQDELSLNSRSMLFKGLPVLGSHETYPEPMLDILDIPFERAGHPPFVVSNELRKEVI